MSDFFSFEYFDDEPQLTDGPPDGLVPVGVRKNQSLSAKAAEYLRQAMGRLVPSTFVYGESGIGNRSYELYILCVSHAFAGIRSSHLVAALCVMHASYERRSDLVILPTDIEFKYADIHHRQIRYNHIHRAYHDMCTALHLPRLSVSTEKLLERIFREACNLPSEGDIYRYTNVGSRIHSEIVSSFPPTSPAENQNTFRPETVAGCSAILTCRYFKHRDVTLLRVAESLHVSRNSLNYCLKRYLDIKWGKVERTESVVIGELVVPRGLTLRPRDTGETSSREEIFALTPAIDAALLPARDDELGFLFSQPEPTEAIADEHVGEDPVKKRRKRVRKSDEPTDPPIQHDLNGILADFSDLLNSV
jgi:hypothetical protein